MNAYLRDFTLDQLRICYETNTGLRVSKFESRKVAKARVARALKDKFGALPDDYNDVVFAPPGLVFDLATLTFIADPGEKTEATAATEATAEPAEPAEENVAEPKKPRAPRAAKGSTAPRTSSKASSSTVLSLGETPFPEMKGHRGEMRRVTLELIETHSDRVPYHELWTALRPVVSKASAGTCIKWMVKHGYLTSTAAA